MIQFNSLNQKNILQVVDKFIIELEQFLSEKNVTISIGTDVREWIANKGYDRKYGAEGCISAIHLVQVLHLLLDNEQTSGFD